MAFTNRSSLVVAYIHGHIVERLDVESLVLETYAGIPGTSGQPEPGHRLSVILGSPFGIAVDDNNQIYVSLLHMKVIVAINQSSDEAKVLTSLGVQPKYLSYDHATRKLFLTMNHGLAELGLDGGEFNVLTGGFSGGNGHGTMEETKFRHPVDMSVIDSNTIIVADETNCR